MTADAQRKLAELIEQHEGRVRYMYPDSLGNVTVGVGHLLATVGAAAQLPFYSADGQKRAGLGAICSAFASVRNQHKPYHALILFDEDIDKLLDADMGEAIASLKRTFPENYHALPDTVTVALADIAYNCGTLHAFPKLIAAVREGNWQLAAEECRRRNIGETRNEDTRQMFLAALATDTVSV